VYVAVALVAVSGLLHALLLSHMRFDHKICGAAAYQAETAVKRLVILWTKVDVCKTTTAWRSTLLLADDELGVGDSAERSKTSLKLLRCNVTRQAANVEPHGGLADGHGE